MKPALELAVELEARRYEAMAKGDSDGLLKLFSGNLLYQHSNGTSDTRESYVATIEGGLLEYLRIDHEESDATRSSHALAVIGSMRAEVILNGAYTVINNRHMALWADEGAEWRMLAYFPSPAT